MMPRHPQQLFHPPPPAPHPAQTQAMHPDIPMSLLTRIAQEEAADSKDDSPIHIIAREEIIPIFHPASPEGNTPHYTVLEWLKHLSQAEEIQG